MIKMVQTENKNKETRQEQQGSIQRVQEATAETRDPPSQDPRDRKEQPFRHPDTLKQTPTTPGRNESGEKSYRSETGE